MLFYLYIMLLQMFYIYEKNMKTYSDKIDCAMQKERIWKNAKLEAEQASNEEQFTQTHKNSCTHVLLL